MANTDDRSFESTIIFRRIHPVVTRYVNSVNLLVMVKTLVFSEGVEVGEHDLFRPFRIEPQDMNALRTTLREILVRQLRLTTEESVVGDVANAFVRHMSNGASYVLVEFEDIGGAFEVGSASEAVADVELAEKRMSKLARMEWKEEGCTTTTCPVCWDEFADGVEVVRTNCAHLFHDSCLRNWLKGGKKNGCPMCRAPIS